MTVAIGMPRQLVMANGRVNSPQPLAMAIDPLGAANGGADSIGLYVVWCVLMLIGAYWNLLVLH